MHKKDHRSYVYNLRDCGIEPDFFVQALFLQQAKLRTYRMMFYVFLVFSL